jgi:hypothetical protein
MVGTQLNGGSWTLLDELMEVEPGRQSEMHSPGRKFACNVPSASALAQSSGAIPSSAESAYGVPIIH